MGQIPAAGLGYPTVLMTRLSVMVYKKSCLASDQVHRNQFGHECFAYCNHYRDETRVRALSALRYIHLMLTNRKQY